MNNNIIIILLVILLLLIYFNSSRKENFQDKCNFDPVKTYTWGSHLTPNNTVLKSKDECTIACSKRPGCNTEECIYKCSNCKDNKICLWVPHNTCKYKPSGLNVPACIDTCLNRIEDDSSCGDTFKEKYNICRTTCSRCINPVKCKWVDKNIIRNAKCRFKPWGPSKQGCIDRCMGDDRELWGGNDCSIDSCTEICENCADKELCKWEIKEPPEEPPEIVDDNAPPKQSIKLIPSDKKIIVQWKTNQHKDAEKNKDIKIIGFVIQYYKTYKDIEGVFTKNISVEDDIFDQNGNFTRKNNTYIINNLDNGDNYSVGLSAVNKYGIGELSNIDNVVPDASIKVNFT